MLQIRSIRSEDHLYKYKKTYEKVHNISPLYRCFRCDALLESARPGGFRIANWDPPRRVPRGPSGVCDHAAPDTSQKVGKYTSELVFSIGSEASYTHASEAHSRN